MLNAVLHGLDTDAPPLVIAHGLFGSGRNWGAIAKRLAAGRRVIAVDMRNHGDSPHAPDHGYHALADDLVEVIAAHGGRADLLGHSMGGKAAMVLALGAPERVARLVVADIAPTRYGHTQMGYIEAMRAVDLGRVARRSDADAMLAETIEDPGTRAFLLQSLAIGAAGAAWKLPLDTLAAEMPKIMGFPELDGVFRGPALFLTGQRSDYVRPEHWPTIRRFFPAAVHVEIEAAGHWLHADQPQATAAAIDDFLARAPR